MSVEAVVARVEQLHGLVSAAVAPGGNGGQDFASQLTAASSAALAVATSPGSGAAAPAATGSSTTPLGVSFGAATLSAGGSPLPVVSGSALPLVGGAASPVVGSSALPAGIPFGTEITAAARRNGLDPALLAGLVRQESNFDPSAGSPAGARGLTQLMPATAAALGVTDATDPAQALEGGARYLAQQLRRFGGDVTKALAAYNAGPGAVQRFGGVPPYAETQAYVQKVQAFAAAYRGTAVPSSLPYSIA